MLKLEPPYKDDAGNRLPVLLDILPDGTRVYEPAVDPQKSLAERLRRVFAERGLDFFDRNTNGLASLAAAPTDSDDTPAEDEPLPETAPGPMTPEELYKMRVEVLPQLFTALGEMTHAKELLSMLLSSTPSESTPASSIIAQATGALPTIATTAPALSATTVTKPAPIVSVQAFNAQLTLGGKDEALRKAAGVFKTAAESIERARVRGERYWVDALKIRRANWGLIPAPLPFGAPTARVPTRRPKTFSSPPAIFRRRAVGRMPTYEQPGEPLVFPHRQRTRLFISVSSVTDAGAKTLLSQNTMPPPDDASLDGALKAAQQEIVEQEIFSLLVKEAGSLPTASARVSERLIVIDAAQAIELKFELIDADAVPATRSATPTRARKTATTGTAGVFRAPSAADSSSPPLLLRPVIELLQYQVFCARLQAEMVAMGSALTAVGILSALRFEPVGGTGQGLVDLLDAHDDRALGGEAPHGTSVAGDARDLVDPTAEAAAWDEVERCLLQRICEVGRELCEHVGGIWFIDLSRCVGRWEGCVLNFRIFVKDAAIHCAAFRLGKAGLQQGDTLTYSTELNIPLLAWAEGTIRAALAQP
ncbi:subunit 17 of mediator complex-domain-containing protein [Mycena leptocephala]|nr:subunit 17 of mediator complex-domain-containing protein [Mycena leptocephala]